LPSVVPRTPKILILDGSFGEGCVALLRLDDEATSRVESAPEQRPHQPLVARAAALIPDTAARSELVAVLVGVGPGSYTGLRAAASLAAGVAAALNIPVIQVPSDRALLLARDASGQTDPVVLSLGVREVLVVDAAGSRIAERSGAPTGADLERIAPHLPAALASAAAEPINVLRTDGWRTESGREASEIVIRYPAPPRGAEGGVAQ
jgi:tRNA A37 threonylcarbamoyladenosine modification protein TsaB